VTAADGGKPAAFAKQRCEGRVTMAVSIALLSMTGERLREGCAAPLSDACAPVTHAGSPPALRRARRTGGQCDTPVSGSK
jgi:hypothetical protein